MQNTKTITISEMAYVHYFHPNEEGFENPEYREALNEWIEKNNVKSISYNSAEHEESDSEDSSAYPCPILDIHDTKRTVEVTYNDN